MAETKKPEVKQPEVKAPAAQAPPAKAPEAKKPAEVKKPEAKKPEVKKPTEPYVIKTLNDKASILYSTRFSPCGKYLLAGGNTGRVLRWSAVDAKDPAAEGAFAEMPALAGHNGWLQGLEFAPQGKRVFTGDSWGRLRAWDYSTWTAAAHEPQPIWDLPQAHDGWLRHITVSPDGKTVATCGRDKFIRLWDAATGKKLGEVRNPTDVFLVLFSPDGSTLASGDHAGLAKLWDMKKPLAADAKPVKEFDAKKLALLNRLQDVGGVRSMAFTPDGKQLLVGGTQPKNGGNVQGTPTILTFDIATAKEAKPLLELGAYVYPTEIRFLHDGSWAVTLSGNPGSGKLLLMKAGETKPYFESTKLSNCHSVAVHPTVPRLAIAGFGDGVGGNGRGKNAKPEEYRATWTPISVLDIPDKNQTA
ncbi:MAG: hypothetical protein K8U03_12885 [Planctomycetia bacterium]|nr:hypothetical protein [Planctomycetia bacterium]